MQKKNLDNAKKVLAVGTTVTRTIEYYARTNKIQGECHLFLNPMNKPIKVDYLLTNFHLPKIYFDYACCFFYWIRKNFRAL